MLEDLKLSYGERSQKALNPAGRALFELMEGKKTNLILSNDEIDPAKFLQISETLGPEIAVLKTHIDTLRSFTSEITKRLSELATEHNFLLFEDRKFADIGNTVQLQYAEGVYRIADWANIVNLHVLPGPGIIKAINEVIKGRKDDLPRGIVILAQMSPEGNLATGEYTEKAVEFGNGQKDAIVGYIGNGGDVEELKKLVRISFVGHAIMAPGVQIQSKGDALGQRYTQPGEVIAAGADCIIVGRGIYKAENPLEMAKTYRKAGWDAYLKRIKA